MLEKGFGAKRAGAGFSEIHSSSGLQPVFCPRGGAQTDKAFTQDLFTGPGGKGGIQSASGEPAFSA